MMPGNRRASIVLRPHHQEVVVPGGGDLERAPGGRLAAHVAQVGAGRRRLPAGGGHGHGIGLSGKDLHRLVEVVGREHRHRLREAGLDGVLGGNQQPLQALPACRLGDGDRALDRPQPAVQAQLGGGAHAAHGRRLDLTAGGQDRERDGQIEPGSLLALAGGCQVDGDPHHREPVGGGADAAAHALARLLDGAIGQAHHREAGRGAALDVGLDLDAAGIDARDPEAGGRRDHAATLRRRRAWVGDGTCRNRRRTATAGQTWLRTRPAGAARRSR
jgi:hypothetical protein